MQGAWADATFELKAHAEKADVVILSDVDELTTRVDDAVVTMGNILASPHVGPIRREAEEFGEKLNLLQVKGDPKLDVQYFESVSSQQCPRLDQLVLSVWPADYSPYDDLVARLPSRNGWFFSARGDTSRQFFRHRIYRNSSLGRPERSGGSV